MRQNKVLRFDLMRPVGRGYERFIATLQYPYEPLFKLNLKAMLKWIEDKRPSVKGKPLSCHFYDEGKTVLYFNMTEREFLRHAE